MDGNTMTHLVIGRAADADPDEGGSMELRLGLYENPSPAELIERREALEIAFEAAFHTKPARVGVVVLPWISEYDDPEEEP